MEDNKNSQETKRNEGQLQPLVIFLAVDGKRDFIVINANEELNDEQITNDDIEFVTIKNLEKIRSNAWSSNCKWTFVIQKECIYLINTYDDLAIKCKKKSIKFFDMYLNAN